MSWKYVDWSKVNPDEVLFERAPLAPGERAKSNREIIANSIRNQKILMRMDELTDAMKSASDVDFVLRDNVVGELFSEVLIGGPVDAVRIDEAAGVLGIEFCPEYRRFLERVGHLRFRNVKRGYHVNVYGVGDSGRMSVVACTQDARKAGFVPDNTYVIDRIVGKSIFPEKSHIVQNATGVVFMVYPDGTAEPGWEDLLTYVKSRLDTSLY